MYDGEKEKRPGKGPVVATVMQSDWNLVRGQSI